MRVVQPRINPLRLCGNGHDRRAIYFRVVFFRGRFHMRIVDVRIMIFVRAAIDRNGILMREKN